MKKLIALLFISTISISLLSQKIDVKFDLVSKSIINVTNKNNYSARILVFDNTKRLFDDIVSPNSSKSFEYKYSKSSVKNMTYKIVYDDIALDHDINNIKSIKRLRDQRRAEQGIWYAIGKFIDQAFFDGKISALIEIGQYGVMLFSGATEEEWADALTDSAIGFGIDKTFDNNYQKGIASAAFELAKSMDKKEYKDLQEWLAYYMRLRSKAIMKEGYIIESAKLPTRKSLTYPLLAVNVSYPFKQSYIEQGTDSDAEKYSIKSMKFNNENSYEVRLIYKTPLLFGFFADYAKTNMFLNNDNENFMYLTPGNAFRFESYSLGFCLSSFYLEFDFGGTYLMQKNYKYESNSQLYKPDSEITKIIGFIEPKINLDLGKYITLTSSYRLSMFQEKEIVDNWSKISSFNVGIRLNLRKSELDFTN